MLDNNIFSIQVAPVKGHIKKGKYVSAHLHFDILYLLEAEDKERLIFKEDESKGVKWISLEEATNNEILDFIRPVNKKIIDKINTTL